MNTGARKMKLLPLHITGAPGEGERFDTLISPSATVATLGGIAASQGVDFECFDWAFPEKNAVMSSVRERIEKALSDDRQPVLLCTTLIYNAKATLEEAGAIKREFGERVKIILGGQLIPFATQAYITNPNIDAACVGDAEVLLPSIIGDIKRGNLHLQYTGWLNDSDDRGKFAFVDYRNFFMLKERMDAQRRISGFSQLTIQGLGGPGCSWAAGNKNGACDFCSLQNIEQMNTRTLPEQMEAEYKLQSNFSPDRLFDVSNQFLPFLRPEENIRWLKEYIEKRKEYGLSTAKYVYLTVASVNDEIAELLKQAGITEVYLGVDHFDSEALREENKSHRTHRKLEATLNALKNNGIKVRMGLVIGSSCETKKTLQCLKDGMLWLKENYQDAISAVGVFPIYVLPGSKVYEKIKKIPLARSIIRNFEERGFFEMADEERLTEIYIKEFSRAKFEEVIETMAYLKKIAAEFAIAYDFRHSPGAEALRE